MSGEARVTIRLEGVDKFFGGKTAGGANGGTLALKDISLELTEGEFVCLLGPSGCGKSTILNLIAGFDRPTSGEVLVNGTAVEKPTPERGMVFQQPTLFPWLTVIDNVTFGPRMLGVARCDYLPPARKYLRNMGLEGFENHYPWQLSGGMCQRVALARAWISSPGILLMDEPFGALDAQTRLMMQELLVNIWESARTTILFVTHDVDEALYLADRVLVMSARPGRIVRNFTVPGNRPRDIENLASDPSMMEIRRDVLRCVRDEVRKSMEHSTHDSVSV
ncbi:MAG: ABC transporter ATP-binding protein [Methylobacteriaceae bacterium]|jgi:NitT/TauT family transport system ATP-binding protein|nr:ABC transporter ATP-binding protein [Methylobacteriaceae bacterium]